MTNCKNCDTTVDKKFCSHCGQPAQLKRFDGHYIAHEIQHLLHVEKGILFTTKELLIRPGQRIREYITENRNRLIKPIPFLVITSLIYSFINHYFHIESEAMNSYVGASETGKSGFEKTAVFTLLQWVQNHYGYANILMGGFIAIWLKLFFRKYPYNFFEISVLLFFIMGEAMLLSAVGSFFAGITKSVLIYEITNGILLIYATWVIGQFFKKKKATSYIKALTAYILGMIFFFISLFIIGILYDRILK